MVDVHLFTSLNATCPKYPYPLPNIDRVINGSSYYKNLSFMDPYFSYNQIKMEHLDAPKMKFMSNNFNYYYNVMPFILENTNSYQRIMNALFSNQIGYNINVYIDDMTVKTPKKGSHYKDLEDILE